MAVAAPLILAAQVAGAGVKAVGALKEGEANRQAALYQAGVAQQQAQFAQYQGQKEAERKQMETGFQVADQRVAAAANGVDVNTGSAFDLQTSQRLIGEMDANMIRENARNRARGLLEQGQLYRMEAKNARTKGYFDAFSSILGGATSVASGWMNFKSMGSM